MADERADGQDEPAPVESAGTDLSHQDGQDGRAARFRAALSRAGRQARDLDRSEGLRTAVQRVRRVLPGDAHFGDPLSLGGARHAEFAGRAVVGLTGDRPGVTREVGLGGLQLWQSVLERFGGGVGEREVVLVFTDLVDFSRWALQAGDDEVQRAMRAVSEAWEKPVTDRAGTVVKRLGDGMMAALADPTAALEAVFEARRRLADVALGDWTPRMRAGLHLGRPRRVGGDYLGVAVNTAARLGERAAQDEIL
ncbi:MAG TPA: adenylate/guanylate cyclase domain-containing protein, partial [Actinomycetospora sp.]|nr:adenylate/guanylate cyclase domain-containing protein [Actinomycetospora sp.]